MSILPVANSQPERSKEPAPGTTAEKPPTQKKKRRNFAQIHSKPLPLETHPLPAFHPSNPISLLRLAYTWISHILFPPTSHPSEPCVGHFSPETRSVHITDPQHARALWEPGFFGKGTLSRSEPSWLEREKTRLRREKYGGNDGKAAEDATRARREERRLFKLERARVESERIEWQRMVEEGKLDLGEFNPADQVEGGSRGLFPGLPVRESSNVEAASEADNASTQAQNGSVETDTTAEIATKTVSTEAQNGSVYTSTGGEDQRPDAKLSLTTERHVPDAEELDLDIDNQEHLQLTFEEAFFLTYGLGVLSVFPPRVFDSPPMSPKSSPQPCTTHQLLELFSQYFTFPFVPSTDGIAPDDQFLLNYVTYHHFRSLGWVVRPGVKFAVDYLLYNRGPVFSHAEFAVLIIPAYSHRDWNSPGGRSRRRVDEQKDWWWLHCVNRVQSQVKKTLVLCYVDVPSPFEFELDEVTDIDIGKLLRSYKIQEFVVRRWLANRSRD